MGEGTSQTKTATTPTPAPARLCVFRRSLGPTKETTATSPFDQFNLMQDMLIYLQYPLGKGVSRGGREASFKFNTDTREH